MGFGGQKNAARTLIPPRSCGEGGRAEAIAERGRVGEHQIRDTPPDLRSDSLRASHPPPLRGGGIESSPQPLCSFIDLHKDMLDHRGDFYRRPRAAHFRPTPAKPREVKRREAQHLSSALARGARFKAARTPSGASPRRFWASGP